MVGEIIDVHHHLAPPSYVDLIATRLKLRPIQVARLRDGTPEKSLEEMDRAGLRMAMISLTTPGVSFGDVAEARRLARLCNDYAARAVADHPGRYGMFAVLPLPDIEGSLAEAAYALDQLKADGIGLYTSYGEKHLGDAAFAPLFEELNRRKAVVYTHPTRPDCCANLLPEITEAAIEYGTDTTRTIASLVFSGAATRYRDIRFLFSHAGGTMPFLINRFIALARAPEFAARLPEGLLPELQRFYYDTAQAAHPAPMAALLKVVPVAQLLFGTDFPYNFGAAHVAGLGQCGLTPAELRAIETDNAKALLPRCRH